jgi:hypothetical protein
MSYCSDVLSTCFMRWDLYTIESTGKTAPNGQFQNTEVIRSDLHSNKSNED